MAQDILVLGAGMVGTSAALELALRGHTVTLVDRRPPGQETSYGNAGVIQGEAVEPYAFPRDVSSLVSAALERGLDVHWHMSGVWAAWPPLLRYWMNSAPALHRRISREYASLITIANAEHARYIDLAGAGDLVRRSGLRFLYRQRQALDEAVRDAERRQREYGVGFTAMDSAALAVAEPALRVPLPGAVHWHDSWSVSDPGGLVERYAALFQQRGGRLLNGDAATLRPAGAGWRVDTEQGPVDAAHAVLALGPWAGSFTRRLGYRLPLFVKRGYHRHYTGGGSVNAPLLDAERGYVLSAQRRGLRLTTGAEIARIDARPTPRQLAGAEVQARQLLDIGAPVEKEPWLGSRPCCADMKPVIGAAPHHRGLWFDFGHGHQGFTLGPASARLLADLIEGRSPCVAAQPFSPARFGT
jgi:D-amino-acid dehydrogenase